MVIWTLIFICWTIWGLFGISSKTLHLYIEDNSGTPKITARGTRLAIVGLVIFIAQIIYLFKAIHIPQSHLFAMLIMLWIFIELGLNKAGVKFPNFLKFFSCSAFLIFYLYMFFVLVY